MGRHPTYGFHVIDAVEPLMEMMDIMDSMDKAEKEKYKPIAIKMTE